MHGHFLGIDVGTSAVKALLLAPDGRVRATAAAEVPLLAPRPGWTEQHPQDWWSAATKATRAVLRAARCRGADIRGVGLSGQMHGSVFLDRNDAVLCPALLWNDQRTTAECAELVTAAGGRAALLALTSNVALTGYTAPKILWLRNHRRALFRRLRRVLLPKDYVTLRLTGVATTDVSDASGTLLFDVQRRTWSLPLLERLRLDPAWFPPAAESPTVVGTVTRAAARATGLVPGTPVVAGAGDQAAAAVGTGVVRRGLASVTTGTSGVVFAHADAPVPNDAGVLQSFCHAVPGAWCVFGCMLSAGASLAWAREVLYADALAAARTPPARDALYSRMLADAARAPESADALFHPYLSGERCPYPHPHARAALLNMTRSTDRAALVRAIVEGVTLNLGAQFALLGSVGVRVRGVRLAGGGARNATWCQWQADAFGLPCATLATAEGSALGAALLAAVGAGAFRSIPAACAAVVQPAQHWRPRPARTRVLRARAVALADTYTALEPHYRAAQVPS